MKNILVIAGLALFCPMGVMAQGVPLYIETNGQLDFTGEYLDDADIAALLGGERAVDTFGPPEFIAQDARTGTVLPVWASLRDYEFINGGDGILENRHDDLTVKEGEELAVSDISDSTQPDFLQPAHGVWTIALTRSDAVGCPPGISELATAQLARSRARDIIFSEPGWVPADLNPDYALYSWRPVGTDGFQSEPYSTGPQAAGSGVSLVVTITLSAKSERQIDVRAQIQMDLAPALAAMAGGATTCLATVTGSYTKN